jgi:hypothetical protein
MELQTILEKFNNSIDNEKLFEMVQINVPQYDSKYMPHNYEVIVNTDDHIPPHFHYKHTKGMDIKVDIVTLEVIDSKPSAGVAKKDLKSWEGLTDERDILKNWLKRPYALDKKMTNHKAIKFTWNLYHTKNLVF